jgi:hypothetical protein
LNIHSNVLPVTVSLSALVLPNFLVVRGGNFRLADSTINLTPAFCTQALASASWYVNGGSFLMDTVLDYCFFQSISRRYLKSVPLKPLVIEGRQFSVFFRDYGFDLGQVTMSLCADENLDRFLNTLVERDMMPRRDAWLLCVWVLL